MHTEPDLCAGKRVSPAIDCHHLRARCTRLEQPHQCCNDLGRRLTTVDVADAHACVHCHVAGVAVDATAGRHCGLPPGLLSRSHARSQHPVGCVCPTITE